MSDSPADQGPPEVSPGPVPAVDANQPAGTPYLLVMPPTEGAPQPMAWPGPDGQPAWAIPVTIPAGTRGYAVFVPLLPTDQGPTAGTTTHAPQPVATVTTPQPVTVSAAAATAAEPAASAPSGAPETHPAATPPPAPAAPKAAPAPAPATARPIPPGHLPGRRQPVGPVGPPISYGMLPPPTPGFLATRWPGPEETQGWAVPAGVLAGALGLAMFLPLGSTGIGWFLGWLTLTVGVLAAVWSRTAELPRTERLVRAAWGGSALALMSVLAFRNAWWLVTFCVLGALGCAALAIIGGRQVRSILFSLVATPFAAFRGLPWVRRHLRVTGSGGAARRVTLSVAATVVVLLVFGKLLSSADKAFSVLLDKVIPEISLGSVFRWLFLFGIGWLIAVAGVYTLSAPPDLSSIDKPGARRLGPVEWALPIAALTLLFAGFVVVQFTVLFGGERHVLRTAKLNYAEYARSGFWQLVVVTLLTLAVLGGVTRWARRERAGERALLRVLLGLLSALSVVIVFSALSRMYTYQKVYSFTGERIFVMAFELLLGTVFVMIMLAGLRLRGTWIPRAVVGLGVVMLLSLAVLNPEAYAAERNMARYRQSGKIDAWYLRALSADATPALAKLSDPVRRCTLSWIADDLKDSDPWYAWNLGRSRARAVLDDLGPGAIGGQRDCRRADQFDLPKTRQPR